MNRYLLISFDRFEEFVQCFPEYRFSHDSAMFNVSDFTVSAIVKHFFRDVLYLTGYHIKTFLSIVSTTEDMK